MHTKSSFLNPKRGRFIYKMKPLPEVPAETQAPEEEISLQDAYEKAKAELARADARIKKIKAYYEKKKMPADVKKAYDEYVAKRAVMFKYVESLRKKLKPKGEAPNLSAEEEKVHKRTLSDVEQALAFFRTAHQGSAGDPMQEELGMDMESGVPEAETGKGKKKSEVPAADMDRKMLLKKNPDAYWRLMQQEVVRKMLEHFASGTEVKLEKDEKTSVRFIAIGGSREVTVDGKKYTLERDKSGYYARLREFEKAQESVTGTDEAYIPYVAVFEAAGKAPIWPKTSELDYKLEKMEHQKIGLRKKVQELFSPKTAPGTRVSFDEIDRREKISDTEERVTRHAAEIVRQADGSVRVTTTERVYLRKNKMITLVKTRESAPMVYTDLNSCMADLEPYVRAETEIKFAQATPEMRKAEEEAFESERNKTFESLASTLAVMASVISQPVEPDRADFMGKKKYKKDAYYGTKYEAGAWDTEEEGKGKFDKKAFAAAMTTYQAELAEYNTSLHKAENKVRAYLQKHPITYNKYFPTVKVRVQVEEGQLLVSGNLERGSDKKVARRYDIGSGIRIV